MTHLRSSSWVERGCCTRRSYPFKGLNDFSLERNIRTCVALITIRWLNPSHSRSRCCCRLFHSFFLPGGSYIRLFSENVKWAVSSAIGNFSHIWWISKFNDACNKFKIWHMGKLFDHISKNFSDRIWSSKG